MKIFIGMDNRQPVAYNVLRNSLEFRSSKPLDIQPLCLEWSDMKRTGLTAFTYTRYMVPHICGYQGKALFLDGDMLALADIHELATLCDGIDAGVSVVKNSRRFEWPSLMYFDNEKCKMLTPRLIEEGTPQDLAWSENVGSIPPEWNHLVGYDKSFSKPKLLHYTMGIPVWPETMDCEYANEWKKVYAFMLGTVSFQEFMGRSVHVPHIKRLIHANHIESCSQEAARSGNKTHTR